MRSRLAQFGLNNVHKRDLKHHHFISVCDPDHVVQELPVEYICMFVIMSDVNCILNSYTCMFVCDIIWFSDIVCVGHTSVRVAPVRLADRNSSLGEVGSSSLEKLCLMADVEYNNI